MRCGGVGAKGMARKGVNCRSPETKYKRSKNVFAVTLSTALTLEFGPPRFFSRTFIFSAIFYSTWQIFGGSHFRKAYRSRKKESKPSEITCKQSEPARTISKIEKRKEFVRHCAMKDARRILSKGSTLLRGCWFGRKSFVFERISMGFSMRWRG